MLTLGYPFRPWKDPKAIADGPSILSYVRSTAEVFGVTTHIRTRLSGLVRVITAAQVPW